MGREIHRLSTAAVRNAKPGMHCDGGGLYLQATARADDTVSKSWVFRYATGETRISGSGKPRRVEREMGLGSLDLIGLAEARAKADECRRLHKLGGIDPIEARRGERAKALLNKARAMTFDQCRDAYLTAHRPKWRNTKHATQWINSLDRYVTPIFGKLPVQAIDVGLVTKALEPIWTTKPETAGRVRGRVEVVLDWARARDYRTGENPARWRGHLDKLLPAHAKVRRVKHHAALPYDEIGTFMASLRERPTTAAGALEFAILTAARTGEVLGAKWGEIDLQARVWTVPGDRMKSGREHRVPLSEAALAVLKRMAASRESDRVFPGNSRPGLSHMALLNLLRRLGRSDLTAHGFRSTFRDWAGDHPSFPREVAEAALAHVVGDSTEQAYRRGDALEKRRKLMDAWAAWCAAPATTGKVLPLRAAE